MPNDIYEVPISAGRLATMARPFGDAWLADDMEHLASLGVTDLVSHFTPEEEYALGLSDEAEMCAAAGLRFHRHPIEDRGLPEEPEFGFLIEKLAGNLQRGGFVVTHCRGGIGRSSVTAAALLVRMGMAPGPALKVIAQARGCPVPDTMEQYDFVMALKGR